MPIIYGDPNKRRRYEAFQIVEQSKHEPLKEAIATVLKMRASAEMIEKAIEAGVSIEDRGKLSLALTKCLPDEFHAWIKIAEFVYAKPRQSLEISGTLKLDELLGHWDQPKQIGVVE